MAVMLPEDQLKEMYALTKENNRMLKDMRRAAFIGGVIHFIWWLIILVVLPYLTWLFLEPYLTDVLNAYESAQAQSEEASAAFQKLQELGNNFNLQGIIDQFTGGATTTGE